MNTANDLATRGLFRETLGALKADSGTRDENGLRSALLAEVLEKTGDYDRARDVARGVIARQAVDPAAVVRCLTVLATISHERGDYQIAIADLNKALAFAAKNKSHLEYCWAKLRLLLLGGEDPDLTTPTLATVRRDVLRYGNLSCSIALHTFVAQLETQKGLLDSARRHATVASSLLVGRDDLWLSGLIAVDLMCVAIMTGELEEARQHGDHALELSRRSGHLHTQIAALSNLAHIDLAEDKLKEAHRKLKSALRLCTGRQRSQMGILDGLAQVELARRDYDACREYIKQIEACSPGRVSWPVLWSQLTRGVVLLRTDKHAEALRVFSDTIRSNEVIKDRHLRSVLMLLRAEAHSRLGNLEDASADMLQSTASYEYPPLVILAEYQRVLGCCLVKEGDPVGARDAYARAARILHAIGHIRAEQDVAAEAAAQCGPHPDTDGTADASLSVTVRVEGSHTATVATLARPDLLLRQASALLDQAARPDLLGAELLALACDSGAATAAAILSADDDSAPRVESARGLSEQAALAAARAGTPPPIPLGSWRGRAWSLVGCVPATITARTTWMALASFAASARALNEARREERERQALWPIDDPDDPSPGIFLNEQMTELVRIARRIASSPVTVLLTGETGVGKDVFAHIIHDASPRSGKPFVPFNCAAVPHELMESQLFGFRRGAFTGADQSSPGVIRSAAGGTLFLDEIGEVPLDLQAKLLRFLEQGEIHPLGEPQPVRADVRVVAATNRDLEQLVRDGQFREDLYYRLNVIQLWIPPLRERREEIPRFVQEYLDRFAREQNKGRLRVSEEALEYLVFYSWPGNVRQLLNELRRIAALAEANAVIMPEHLSTLISSSRRTRPASERELLPTEVVVRLDQPMAAAVQHVERAMIQYALAQHDGQLDPAARSLGLSRKGLYLKRRRLETPAKGKVRDN